MQDIDLIIWFFPIIFIFHDFEEIIFMKVWINKNKQFLSDKFPKLSKKLLPHFEHITTAAFALGVAEEFIIITIVTIVSFVMKSYGLWLGLFIAFTFHLVIHCIQTLAIRRYTPVIVTSIISLPICIFIIKQVLPIFMLSTVIMYSAMGFMAMVINLAAVHKLINKFSKLMVS